MICLAYETYYEYIFITLRVQYNFVFIWTNLLFKVTCFKNNLILLINPLYHEGNIPDQCKEFALTHVSLKKKWLIALLPYLILVWPGSSTLQCHLTECPWRRTFKLVHVSLYFFFFTTYILTFCNWWNACKYRKYMYKKIVGACCFERICLYMVNTKYKLIYPDL